MLGLVRRLSRVQSRSFSKRVYAPRLLEYYGGASAAYSLRSLNGDDPKAVRIRRDGDNEERDFTTAEIGTEAADWTNGKQETTLPADLGVTSFTQSGLAYGLASYGISLAGGASLDDFDGTFTPSSDGLTWSNGSPLGVNFTFDTNLNQWDLNFNDGTNFGNITISSTTKYPFQVTNWGSATVSSGVSGLQTNWSDIAAYIGFTPIYGATTTYPTADAAYSLRKVRSTYTGHAVRIRRGSDDVEVNVLFDTNDEVSNSSAITNLNPSNFPSGITSFTVTGANSSSGEANGTYVLNTSNNRWFNGSSYFYASGNSWRQFDDVENEGVYLVGTTDGEYPWQVTYSGSDNPVTPSNFSNFVGPDSGDTTATTLGEFLTENIDITNRLIVPSDVATRFVVTSSTDASNYTVSINNGSGEATFSHMRSGLFGEGHYRLRGTLTASNLVGDIKIQTNGGLPDNTQFVSITNGTNNLDFEFDITGDGSTTSAGSVKLFFFINDVASATLEVSNLTWEVTTPDAAVQTWYDQSGNSKNATQDVDANQPLIAEGGVLHTDDGKPALKFNGTSHTLELSAKATIANTSIFSSFRSNTNTQDSVLFHLAVNASNAVSIGFGGATGSNPKLGSRLRVGGSNLVHKGDDTFTSTSQSLLSYIASSSAAKMFVDSTEETATVESRNAGANNRIGARGDDARFFNGDISEIILFDSDQTNNRFKIESNINNHYTIYTAAQNGFVNKWYDQSGNGFNAVADADANEPKIVNSGSLLTDGVKFESGNNLKLSGTGLDIFKNTQHAQVFYVIKINDTSTALTGFFEAQKNAFQARFLLRNSNATAGRISLGGRRLDSDAFVSFQSDSGHGNEKVVLTGFINYSDTDAFIFKNGTQIGSDTSFLTAGATSDTRSANIAIGRASASLTAEFDAEELIIFNTDQTANRTAIETNMINHYGIS